MDASTSDPEGAGENFEDPPDSHHINDLEKGMISGDMISGESQTEVPKGNEKDPLFKESDLTIESNRNELKKTRERKGPEISMDVAGSSQAKEEETMIEMNWQVSQSDDLNNQCQVKLEPVEEDEANSDSNNFGDDDDESISCHNNPTEQLNIKPDSGVAFSFVSSAHVFGKQPPGLIYRCKYCGQQLKKISSLQQHEEAHRDGTIYKCRFCEYYSVNRVRIAAHECKHTGEKPFSCDQCEFRCASRCDLSKHGRVHDSARPYKCQLCAHTSKSHTNLRRHMRSHSNYRPFSCDLCDWKFKTKSALDNHKKIHSDLMDFFCDKCDYACKTSNQLRQHVLTHSEVRNFACSHPGCMQRCKTKSDLTKHMSVHKTSLDFKCVLCNKRYKSRHSLRSHTRRHEKQDCPCKICGKVLQGSNSLNKHMLALHTGGKKIECLICKNKFSTKVNLKAHLKVHARDRSFLCPICLHGFRNINHLFTHIGASHGKDYVYVCDICNRPFSRYMMMKFHIDRNHMKERDKKLVYEFEYDRNCLSYDPDEFDRKLKEMLKILKRENKWSANMNNSNSYLEDVKPNLDLEMSELALISNQIHSPMPSQNLSGSTLNNGISFNYNGNSENGMKDPESTSSSQVLPTFDSRISSNDEYLQAVQNDCNIDIDNIPELKNPAITDLVDFGKRTLTVKLERLDESIVLSGKSNVENNESLSSLKCSKIIRLGSYANVSINLTGKDSGFKFNMKKGKKCKGWFADPDNMIPEAREKTINYLVKQANFTQRKPHSKRKVRKRGKNDTEDRITSGLKRSPHKGKAKKKSGSVSVLRGPLKLSIKKKKMCRNDLASDVNNLSDNVSIKTEVQDNYEYMTEQFNDRDLSLQCDNQQSETVHRQQLETFHDNDNEITINVEFQNVVQDEYIEKDDEIFYSGECHSKFNGGRAKNMHGSISVGGEMGKFGKVCKKLKPSKKKRQQKLDNSTVQRNVNSFKSTKGITLPQLKVVIPNIMKDGRLNGLFVNSKQVEEKQLANQVPGTVLEVEKVIDSPLQVTWKTVGGHKDSRIYKRMMGSAQSGRPDFVLHKGEQMKKDGQTNDLKRISESTTKVTSSDGSHYGFNTAADSNVGYILGKEKEKSIDTVTVSDDRQFENSTLMSGNLVNENCDSQGSELSESKLASLVPISHPAQAPSSESNTNIKVMSLKEFEDEYRKRPKVVANVSLNSNHTSSVVQSSGCRKRRKRTPTSENGKKKRLTLKINKIDFVNEMAENITMNNDEVSTPQNKSPYISEVKISSTEFNSLNADINMLDDYGNAISLAEDCKNSKFRDESIWNSAKISTELFPKPKRKYTFKNPRKSSSRKPGKKNLINRNSVSSEFDTALIKLTSSTDNMAESDLDLNASTSALIMQQSGNEKPQVECNNGNMEVTQVHKLGKAVQLTSSDKRSKIVLSPKSAKDKNVNKHLAIKENSEKLKDTSSKPIFKKKIACRNKINVSALFGKTLERKASPQIARQTTNLSKPDEIVTHHVSYENTNYFQKVQPPFASLKAKQVTKQGRVVNRKTLNKTPDQKLKKKENSKTITNSGQKNLKPNGKVKGTLDKQQTGVKSSNKNTPNANAKENRIKLPGLISIDMMERRLTVECVTLSPKVLLRRISPSDLNCHKCNLQQISQDNDLQHNKDNITFNRNPFNFHCSERVTGETVTNRESSLKMESVGDNCIVADSNLKDLRERMNLSLSLALYDNCTHGLRNSQEACVTAQTVTTSQSSDDLLKMENQSYQTVNGQNSSHAMCDTFIMNKSYSIPVDRCSSSLPLNIELTNASNDMDVMMNYDQAKNSEDSSLLDNNSSTFTLSDKSVMNVEYLNSMNTDISPAKNSSSDTDGSMSLLPLPSPLPHSLNSPDELVCTEELNDCDDNQLTVVVELGRDLNDVKNETPNVLI